MAVSEVTVAVREVTVNQGGKWLVGRPLWLSGRSQ